MKRYLRVAAIVALVAAFGAAGLGKLVDPALFREQFEHLGLPEWWVPLTGAVELLGAALVATFNHALRRLGASILAATMAVATALHMLHDPIVLALPAALLMLLAGYVATIPRVQGADRGLAGA
jgi:hypothetical protein